MRITILQVFAALSAGLLLILGMGEAKAHGIAGNRFFVGTLSFDDPAVNDELASTFSILKHPVPGGAAVDRTLTTEFSRLLTSSISFGAESTWINRAGRGSPSATGFDTRHLSLKGLLFRDDPHEMLIAAGFGWGLPGLASQRLDARGSIEPGVFFGKGFGNLPDSLSVLRPLGISGALSFEHPTGRGPNPDIIRWGGSLQFSTLYLTDRFTGGPPAEEPLFQWVPLVEFTGDTPTRGKSSITASPGIAYVGDNYQIAAELIVPLNREAARNVSFMVKLLLFIDDVAPSFFGKPIFTD